MKLSVFIPTYNGKAKLHALLSRLEKQSVSGFTVHVLIDGSTDDTLSLQTEFPAYAFHTFPNSGRAGIRNHALEICREGILLFLDHDMLPGQDLIATHLAFHATKNNAVLVGNGFRNPADATNDFSYYLVHSEKKWIDSHPVEFEVAPSDFVFTACNLSMPAELFATMKGFDPSLRDGEDFEFGMRLLQSGVKIFYSRKALAWHNDWPTLAQYIHRNSEYLAGKKVLVEMNPGFEQFLKVDSGERSHNRFKQFLQGILGNAAMKNSLFFRALPLKLKFIAFRSAVYKFSGT